MVKAEIIIGLQSETIQFAEAEHRQVPAPAAVSVMVEMEDMVTIIMEAAEAAGRGPHAVAAVAVDGAWPGPGLYCGGVYRRSGEYSGYTWHSPACEK